MNIPPDLATSIAEAALAISSDIAVALDDAMDGSGWDIPPSAIVHRSDAPNAQALAEWVASHAVPRKTAGRPAKMEGGRRVNLYLDFASVEKATQLGNGNISEGIRFALEQAPGDPSAV